MARSSGTYTAPSNSVNPAVEGTTIDEADFNSLVDDLEAALTESIYTSGLGSTDNRLVRTDGTDTKKVQGTGITVDDSDNVSGVAGLTATTINIGNADTTLARSGAGDITVEGNALYRAGGVDVPIADGGTGQSTKTAAFDALSPLTTQGDVLFFDGTNNVRLGTGTVGQVLTAGGAGANPSWTSVAGTGDVTAASAFGTDNRLVRSDGTGKGVQASGVTVDDSANVSGVAALSATTIELGHASDTTLARSGAGDVTVEGNQLYRAGGTDVPVSDGGTGVSALTAYAVICGGTTSTGAVQCIAGVGTAGQVLTSNGAGALPTFQTPTGGGGSATPSPPQGRATLTTGTPVLSSPVSGATTVFYTPYVGRFVPLYNGTSFVMTDINGELSQATTDSTKSPTACAANSNYDLFVWSDGGTFRCTRGPAWTSDTARGAGAGTTELVRVQGVLLNANSITNGPAAQRGTYVGTIRTNGSSQIDYVVGGASAGGTAASIGLWNMYNRVSGTFNVRDSTSSWTYASTTRRSANNSNNNRISMIRGIDEDGVWAFYSVVADGLSGLYAQTTIGLDSTSTKAADATTGSIGNVSTVEGSLGCAYSGLPGLGWHYLQALEFIGGTGTAVYYGGATNNYAHLSATIRW